MDLKITPKPADEVIAKEGSYQSKEEGTLSLQESLALEMNKNAEQLNDIDEILNEDNADIDTINSNNIAPNDNVSTTPTTNPITESVALKDSNNTGLSNSNDMQQQVPITPKTLTPNTALHHNLTPTVINDKNDIPMSEEQAVFIEKNKNIKVGSPIKIGHSLSRHELIDNDNADLLRTNIYYSKKLYEEVRQLRKSIRFQGLVKYFFTAMIVLSSIASLFFGYRLFTEMFSNGDTSNLMGNFGQGFVKQIGANLFNNQTHDLGTSNTSNVDTKLSSEIGKYDKYLDIIKEYLDK